MPNWCFNSVSFTFPNKETYDKFLKAVADNDLFETFVPLNKPWSLETAYNAWGTKWDPHDISCTPVDEIGYHLETNFETAWSPPTKFLQTLWEMHDIESHGKFTGEAFEFYGCCQYGKQGCISLFYEFPKKREELATLEKKIGTDLFQYMSCCFDDYFDFIEESKD